MSDKELTTEEWKQKKKENKARFTAMQRLPYEVKVKRAKIRAYEFVREMDKRGCNTHVSVGGLDSITLLVFLRHIGLKDIPANWEKWKREIGKDNKGVAIWHKLRNEKALRGEKR